jgi:hypothetical protein
MLKTIKYIYILAIIPLFYSSNILAQKQELATKEIIIRMLKSIHDTERFKYNLKITEHGKKGMNHYESAVKLNRNPRKIVMGRWLE